MDEATTFQQTPFAQGRFRLAYMGEYTAPASKRGTKVVVKIRKDTYTWQHSDWDTTKAVHQKASELAQGFNSFSGTNYPIRFTDIKTHKVVKGAPWTRPSVDEYVIVEDYIPGDYKKWCNNYGFVSTESESMPAFMHWSWVHTKGELMVADLQGVWKREGFVLTDPAIMSLNNSYGVTDTGVEGMIMFFYKHLCNQFCQSLPKPKPSDFVGRIPQPQLEACMRMLQSLGGSTTYTNELKFDAWTRQNVAAVLRGVAQRNLA